MGVGLGCAILYQGMLDEALQGNKATCSIYIYLEHCFFLLLP
jgi:hypothetical protein